MSVATALLLLQAVFAGQFLDGRYEALLTHRENATYAGVTVAVAALAGLLVWRPGRGPWWPAAATAALFGLIAVQIALGFSRAIAVHVPLGVTIIVTAAGLTRWSWRDHEHTGFASRSLDPGAAPVEEGTRW
jgi:hypothetical protein